MNPLHLNPLSASPPLSSGASSSSASEIETQTGSIAREVLSRTAKQTDRGHILTRGKPQFRDEDEDYENYEDELDLVTGDEREDFSSLGLSPHADADEEDEDETIDTTPSISVEASRFAPPLTSIEYEKILTPEKILEQLKKIEKQIGDLDQSIEGVFTKAAEIAEKKKVQTVVDLPANKRVKLENELVEKGERILNRQRYLAKCLKGVDPKLPADDPVKMEINRLGDELTQKLAQSKEKVKKDLKFYGNIRLFHFLEMVARILRQLNESIRTLNSMR